MGPHWEGNQVWFVTAGGAIFAAWPLVYATAFSGFYIAMLLVLCGPCSSARSASTTAARWPTRAGRSAWDWGIFVGSAVPALVFGVAVGNVITGVPFHFEETMMPVYTGSFWGLFYAVRPVEWGRQPVNAGCARRQLPDPAYPGQRVATACSAGFADLLGTHARRVCHWRRDGRRHGRLRHHLDGRSAVQSPLDKTVVLQAGAWLNNYRLYPLLSLFPILGFLGGMGSIVFGKAPRGGMAFISSAIAELGIIATAGGSIFPFVLPSNSDPRSSLTAWDCVSSKMTLEIMFWVALIMTPIVLAYTSWAYRVMRGKLTVEYIKANDRNCFTDSAR